MPKPDPEPDPEEPNLLQNNRPEQEPRINRQKASGNSTYTAWVLNSEYNEEDELFWGRYYDVPGGGKRSLTDDKEESLIAKAYKFL